jgi:hypothetical protein
MERGAVWWYGEYPVLGELMFFFAAVLCFLGPDIWIGDLPVPLCRPRRNANNRRSIKLPRLPSKYQSFRSIEYVACSGVSSPS